MAVEERFRPEMRRMERDLVAGDPRQAWKNHLLAMDHLRTASACGATPRSIPRWSTSARACGPSRQMWNTVGERVTDLVFRMEQLDESFVGSTWREAEAIQEDAQAASEIAAAAAGGHRRHPSRPQARADPQPPAARGPQRSLPLRQREEVQDLLYAEGVRGAEGRVHACS